MRTLRLLITLVAGLAVTAFVLADPGIASATTYYNEWQTPDGLCMGVQGGSMAPGTAIISWACDGSLNQFWTTDDFSGQPYTFLLRNLANPAECLSVLQKATYTGAPLVIWPCKGFSDNQDQRWSRPNLPSAPIYNANSGLQILPLGAQGSEIVQWDIRVPYSWTPAVFVAG